MLNALKEMKLEDNTLVIFTSDNGPTSPRKWIHKNQSYVHLDSDHKAAGPYRGFKTDAWDGGVRVPLAVRWPGMIKAGSTSESLFSLYLTFLPPLPIYSMCHYQLGLVKITLIKLSACWDRVRIR